MFALVVDLLRWIEWAHPSLGRTRALPLNALSGVVLIDEVDAHLHPRWQREVGFLLTRTFPRLQFIVTSHSPFVAMAAGEGALSVLRQDGGAVRIDREVPSPSGWAVDQVLSQMFDLDSLRDPDTEDKLKSYQRLRLARGAGKLTPKETKDLQKLEEDLSARVRGVEGIHGSWALQQDLDLITEKLKERRRGRRA
jgi:predicted ATP-binding protein involved in virulence